MAPWPPTLSDLMRLRRLTMPEPRRTYRVRTPRWWYLGLGWDIVLGITNHRPDRYADLAAELARRLAPVDPSPEEPS